MELTFHARGGGKVPKRKYTRGACDACRQRKKKCHHENRDHGLSSLVKEGDFIPYSPNTSRTSPPPAASHSGVQPLANIQEAGGPVEHNDQKSSRVEVGKSHVRSQSSTSSGPYAQRFIGDLNPVVFFVDDASARLLHGRTSQRDVGVWLDGEENELLEPSDEAHRGASSSHSIRYQASRQRRFPQQRAPLLPSRKTQEDLVDIYFRRVHSVFPLINEHEFRTEFQSGSVSSRLVQAVCLVASKDREAKSKLYLPGHVEVLPVDEFSNLLYDDLVEATALDMERRRIVLIQILTLLSLHVQGPDSFDRATMHLTQAIHHAHTVGLHLTKGAPTDDTKPFIALFWCLWSLDRWNAAIHGRPLVINDRDLGQQLADVIDLFEAPFRVWLSLASIMGEVLSVYRPVLDSPLDENRPNIPRFEEILDTCNGWNLDLDVMMSLELAYYAIALLASRPWGLKTQPRSHTLHLRQDLSIYRIVTLAQMCEIEQLLPLPVIAYSISLGFSISYKQLKRCHLPSMQYTAKLNLQTLYKTLESLGTTWWSARVLTRLCHRAFNGMQRIIAEKTNPPGGSRSAGKNPYTDHADLGRASCTFDVQKGAINAAHNSLEGDTLREPQAPPPHNTIMANDNLPPFDFAHLDNAEFGDIAGDPMFHDIDNVIAGFLDINVPKCASHPSFITLDTAWSSEGFECPSFQ
ncbi:hypothetical protein ARAM_000554 [Aspergillus rambellii]|uniref:Xylanolytic transcriptional activator regulatory domain-containing protein n=1 Tax=Aspergillus rambellii TaxID=308745 RepID=A0A0F8W5Q6_9EURO|nr:hypothetical protein ARAM_000554 [Aspergillus rambellii]